MVVEQAVRHVSICSEVKGRLVYGRKDSLSKKVVNDGLRMAWDVRGNPRAKGTRVVAGKSKQLLQREQN